MYALDRIRLLRLLVDCKLYQHGVSVAQLDRVCGRRDSIGLEVFFLYTATAQCIDAALFPPAPPVPSIGTVEAPFQGENRLKDVMYLRHFIDALVRVAACLYPRTEDSPREWLSLSFDRLLKDDIYPSACEVQGASARSSLSGPELPCATRN